jgi:hypothetical protein
MAAVPVERSGPLSDHGLLQRYLMTPQTAGDAFYQVGCLDCLDCLDCMDCRGAWGT